AEDVTQPSPAGRAEEVAEVERRVTARAATREPDAPAGPEQRASFVVLTPSRLVGEHVVRLRDLLEALLGAGVALVRVRVVGARQLPVGLLDLLRRGVLRDAEDLVEVLLEVVLSRHLGLPLVGRRDAGVETARLSDPDPCGPDDPPGEPVP